MMTLTEIDILKSFGSEIEKSVKYIKRTGVPGNYHNQYNEPKKEIHDRFKGGFKEQWKGFKGKPREAFNKLLIEQKGQVEDAFEAALPFIHEDENGKLK